MANKTAEVIAADFVAMGHSVAVITDVIAGDQMADETAADKQSAVDRNVEHLVLKKQRKKLKMLLLLFGLTKVLLQLMQLYQQVIITRRKCHVTKSKFSTRI